MFVLCRGLTLLYNCQCIVQGINAVVVLQCWLPARSYVKAALASRFDVDASGEIIQLDGGGFPWKEHLYDLEKELSVPTEIKFVLYEVTLSSIFVLLGVILSSFGSMACAEPIDVSISSSWLVSSDRPAEPQSCGVGATVNSNM